MTGHFLTLDETITDQHRLDLLCQDRVLITDEIFEPNSYYGMNYILKKFAGLPISKPLKVVLPHGLNLYKDFIWEAEKNALLPIIYNFSPHLLEIYKEKTKKIILKATSPFLYLAKLLEGIQQPKRTGTIFFPSHSTHHLAAEIEFENILKELQALDDKYKPITICIYWRDYNLNQHKIFQKNGYKIVSAGHMFDPKFLFRFYHLCSIHKYASSNDTGSQLFYSVIAGCSFFCLQSCNPIYFGENKFIPSQCIDVQSSQGNKFSPGSDKVYLERTTMLKNLFKSPQEKMNANQIQIVKTFLGAPNMKSSEELKKELEFADKIDKFGFARNPQTKLYNFRVPNLIPRRFLRNTKRFFKK
jgi:hypothetical protein